MNRFVVFNIAAIAVFGLLLYQWLDGSTVAGFIFLSFALIISLQNVFGVMMLKAHSQGDDAADQAMKFAADLQNEGTYSNWIPITELAKNVLMLVGLVYAGEALVATIFVMSHLYFQVAMYKSLHRS